MRRSVVGVLLVTLTASVALAQEDEKQQYAVCFARVIRAMVDVQVLQELLALKLTDAQLQSLEAVYKQFPVALGMLAAAQGAAQQTEAYRDKLLTEPPGDPNNLAEAKAMQQALNVIGRLFGGNPEPGDDFATILTPQELAVWAVLTGEQRAHVMNCTDAKSAARAALEVVGRLRDRDEPAWVKARDRLADSLAAGAGAAGTPARDNCRQLLTDFLDRVRRLKEGDLAKQQEQLTTELSLLLLPGTDFAAALGETAPGLVRAALARTLLRSQTPDLLRAVQANRARRAGG